MGETVSKLLSKTSQALEKLTEKKILFSHKGRQNTSLLFKSKLEANTKILSTQVYVHRNNFNSLKKIECVNISSWFLGHSESFMVGEMSTLHC